MVYRTTLAPLFTLRREMDRLFDDVVGRGTEATSQWVPAVDVREDEQGYRFELELPGVDPARVEITADNGVLTVRGDKVSERKESESARWHVVERLTGSFRRSFQLPPNVAEDRIEAEFSQGLLTVRMPRAELPKPKKIEIKV